MMKNKKSMAGLAPYQPSSDNPWDLKKAMHLLRRTEYCATPVKAQMLLSQSPTEIVDQMIDEAMSLAPPARDEVWNTFPPAPGSPGTVEFVQQINDPASERIKRGIVSRMVDHGLAERMAFIWSDHLVTTKTGVLYAAYMDQYINLLRTHAFGNYKQMVYEMGITPGMLRYLNGNLNTKTNPNENYARELFELFTMGVGDHYTEDDIKEAARALTGWIEIPNELRATFNELYFDDGEKEIFGQRGNWGYDDLIDITFEQRGIETCRYTVLKIYRSFVYAEPDEDIIEELAQIMFSNDFEIEPVVRTLLKSEHFFDNVFVGARIKEPIELITGLIPIFGADVESELVYSEALRLSAVWGQNVLDGPNVAGWDGHRSWLSSGTFLNRWQFSRNAFRDFSLNKEELLSWTTDRSNPYVVAADIATSMLPYDIKEPDLEMFGDIFLGTTPDYEWDPDDANASEILMRYITYIIQLPAFQLS